MRGRRGSVARPGAEGAVNVQPEPFSLADVGQGIEIIESAGVGRPCRTHDAKWQITCFSIPCNDRFQSRKIDLIIIVDRHKAK